MSEQNFMEAIKKRSAWSIFMGVVTAILGLFLISLSSGNRGDHDCLSGLDIDLRWHCPVCIRTSFADGREVLFEDPLGRAVWDRRYCLGVLPIAGVALLTVILGSLLLVYGFAATIGAFELRPVDGWGWLLFDGIATFLAGMLILAKWPSSSLWAIGTLVGVAVLMGGISRIMIATKVGSGVRNVDRSIRRAA